MTKKKAVDASSADAKVAAKRQAAWDKVFSLVEMVFTRVNSFSIPDDYLEYLDAAETKDIAKEYKADVKKLKALVAKLPDELP